MLPHDEEDLLNGGDWDVGLGGFSSRQTTNKKLGFSTTKDFTTAGDKTNSSSNLTNNKKTNDTSTLLSSAYNLNGIDSDEDNDDENEGLASSNKHDGETLPSDLLQQQNMGQDRFEVEEIKFEFSKSFTHVRASKGNLLLATNQNTCIYVDDDFERYREFRLSHNDDDDDEKIHKCFIDPSGFHVLISMTNGDNYYFNTQYNKNPKLVAKLKNMIIESIGWDAEQCNREETGTILLGTNDSKIFECILYDDLKDPVKNSLKLLFDFNDCDMLVSTGPITGIEIEHFPKTKNSFNTYLVLVSTRLRMFEFIGGPTLQDVFASYKQSFDLLKYKELPAKRSDMLPNSELHLFKKDSSSLTDQESFAWLSNAGVYHGVLNFANPQSRQSGTSIITESEVIQYDNKSSSQVISIAISEFHMFVLYPEKLQILMQPPGLCTASSVNPMMLSSLLVDPMNDNQTNQQGIQGIDKFFGYGTTDNSNITGSSNNLNLFMASLTNVGEISLSDIRVVYQKTFPVGTCGELIGMCTDTSNRFIYLYSNSSVWRILIEDEERDVWKLYLEQALDPKSSKESYFDVAFKLCKQDPKTKDIVLSAKADYFFKVGRFNDAANIYAMTSKSFEQVSIAFHNKGQKDALRIYVLAKLQTLKKNIKTENQDATQLCCLCTWLTEMYLDKINELYDLVSLQSQQTRDITSSNQVSFEEQYTVIKNEFRKFLEDNKKYLNKETTFRLITSHGQTEEVLYYAMLIEDYERVISHCITEKEYSEALEILNKFCTTRAYEDYFYKFSPILMQHLPKETVNTLTQKRFLDSGKLIPALMRYISHQQASMNNTGSLPPITLNSTFHTLTNNLNITTALSSNNSMLSSYTKKKSPEDDDEDALTESLDEDDDNAKITQKLNENQQFSSLLTNDQQNHVIRYLEWCIKKQENEDPAIHNLLLTLYADLDDDEKLLTFLDTEGENNFYDPKYALRVCSQKKKIEACVRLYSAMQLFDDAVDLALENDDIDLARECADKPDDDENRKKLWLKIAKHVINHNTGVKQAIEFLSYTDKIKLEDILPYFPDFSRIDDFKEEICKSLDQYKNEIEKLKNDMQLATQTASEIREDIKELKHRYGFITSNAKCDLSSKSVLTTDFYLFPCQHVFRADALVEEVIKHTKSENGREKLKQLEEKRRLYNRQVELLNANSSSGNQSSGSNSGLLDQKELSQLQDELRELDEILSSECPLCGEMMINSIDEGFIASDENQSEILSWSIN